MMLWRTCGGSLKDRCHLIRRIAELSKLWSQGRRAIGGKEWLRFQEQNALMSEDNTYRARAEDCLQKAIDADKEADKWSWLMLAESFFRLSDFRKHVNYERRDIERPISDYAPKAHANGIALSFMDKVRELF